MFSGKRSPEALKRRIQRRKAKQLMLDNAFVDRMNGDVVNLLRPEQILDYLSTQMQGTEVVYVEAVPKSAELGMVLSDPYGRGAFQTR